MYLIKKGCANMLKIWLGNLGKYNEGELVGDWFELPIDDIEEALASIGVSDEPDENGNIYEEYHICDYETNIEGLTVDRYDSLQRLNEIAETLEDIEAKNDLNCFNAILEALGSNRFEEALEYYESGRYIYYGDVEPDDYGREMLFSCASIPDWLESELDNYFDFEAYGESLLYDFTNTSTGYILLQ